MGEIVDNFGVELGGAGLRRAGVLLLGGLSLALGVVAVPGLLLHPSLLLLVGGDGGVAVPAAVVAAVGAGGEVAGEAFVGLILAAVVALWAMHFDVAGGAAGEAGEVDAGLLGLAMYEDGNQFFGGDGIVKCGVENTIASVGRLARFGMEQTDREIIQMMMEN